MMKGLDEIWQQQRGEKKTHGAPVEFPDSSDKSRTLR